MRKLKTRKNVPRIVQRMWTNGFTLEEAKRQKIVLDNCIDVEYHWETLAMKEAENDR